MKKKRLMKLYRGMVQKLIQQINNICILTGIADLCGSEQKSLQNSANGSIHY